jgi:hypothetical protein
MLLSLGNVVVASADLVSELLGGRVDVSVTPGVPEAFAALQQQLACFPDFPTSCADIMSSPLLFSQPGLLKQHPQQVLSRMVHAANQSRLLSAPHQPRDALRLTAVARQEAGQWLSALRFKPWA